MKKKLIWVLAAILTISGANVLTSCNSNDDAVLTPGETNSNDGFIVNPNAQWKVCEANTYIDGLEQEYSALQEVINARFPNQTAIEEAEIAFVTPEKAMALDKKIEDFYERGGLIVVMRPTVSNLSTLPEAVQDDDFTDTEDWDELFFAFNKYEQHYEMMDEPEFDGKYDDETGYDEEQEKQSDEYGKTHPGDESTVPVYDVDNETAHNANYWHVRINPFVNWIEEMASLNQSAEKARMRADGQKIPDYETLKANINADGQIFEHNYPISLNKKITSGVSDDWYINKSSSVSVRYTVYPVYMLSCNGENAGDYYIVTGKVTPHNDAMWGPYQKSGGLFSMGRCRIFGYWFKEMDVKFDLLDGDKMADGLRYQQTPIPENENESVNYSNGFNASITGSVSGGYGGKQAKGMLTGSIGFSVGWSSTTSYTLKTIAYNVNSSTPTVQYHYYSNNVKLTDNGIGDGKYDKNFPVSCRSEFNGTNVWVWHVPAGHAGVADNSTKHFTIRSQVKITYSSWYHWRGAVEYDSNREDYELGWYSYSMDLKAPNRATWGLVSLTNAAKDYTVRQINIYENGKENGEPIVTVPGTYEYNEKAVQSLPEGTYSLTFEYIDPNQSNKVISHGKITGFTIKQGRTSADATTILSTGDATITN